MNNLLLAVIFFVLSLIISIFDARIFHFSLDLGLSWVLSYLVPWIFILICSYLLSKSIRKMVLSHFRIWVPILLFFVAPGFHFALNPIYQGDFNQKGQVKAIERNQILTDILEQKPNFDGLVCVASPTCPHCVEAVQTKVNLLFGRKKVDVAVYLGFGDERMIQQFRANTSAPKIPIVLNTLPKSGLDINEGVIPVFVYIKNNKIVHLWRNDQLGFPALDWVENHLN